MPTPTVSVVMSVYNGLPYLEEAVESVLHQTYEDFEFIIINDGSLDGTKDVLEQLAEQDDRIRLVHQVNRGLPAALNRGIAMSRGKYIARMDADDICLPQRFEKQVDYLDRHPEIAVLGSEIVFIDGNGRETGTVWHVPTSPMFVRWRLLFRVCINHPSVMMRPEAVRSVGGYDEGMLKGQDFDLWARLSVDHMLANVSEPLLKARRWSGSATVKDSDRQKKAWIQSLVRLHHCYIGNDVCDRTISYLIDLQHGGISYLKNNNQISKKDIYCLIKYINSLHESFTDRNKLIKIENKKVARDTFKKQIDISHGLDSFRSWEGTMLRLKIHTLMRPLEIPMWISKNIIRRLKNI